MRLTRAVQKRSAIHGRTLIILLVGGGSKEKIMNKKKTEKARVLAGVEFGKWLFMRGATMPHNTVVTKQADTMRAYGLKINIENWEAVRDYASDFLLSMRHCMQKVGEEETE